MSICLQDTRVLEIRTHGRREMSGNRPRWEAFVARRGEPLPSFHPGWLSALERGLGHRPYCLEAIEGGETRGLLPLAFLKSLLFGRFLVGLPYLNYGGVLADDESVARALIDRAIDLAEELDVRHLELRHDRAFDHPKLTRRPGAKVHMRRPLPADAEALWSDLPSAVRNQVRKARKFGLEVRWGGEELTSDFYRVFSRNMRDLGTPVFGRGLFSSILREFPDSAEHCVVRAGDEPLAAALLVHGRGITEVPSASSLRQHNHTCANMLLYWSLLERSVQRGQTHFDFGRSTPDGSVYKFKKQWGGRPEPAEWQYYVRKGDSSDVRPDNPRYGRMIRVWQRLPVGLTRLLGPRIVRGIP